MGKNTAQKIEDFLGCVVESPVLLSQLSQLGFKTEEPMTFEDALICSQISSAVRGDVNAYKQITGLRKMSSMPLEDFLVENTKEAK